jgi:predicted  nucleic acid-binding Zn-ribbon protein
MKIDPVKHRLETLNAEERKLRARITEDKQRVAKAKAEEEQIKKRMAKMKNEELDLKKRMEKLKAEMSHVTGR